MTAQAVYELVLAILPSLMAIGTFIGIVLKIIGDFKALKKEVYDLKCIDELKKQVSILSKENAELRMELRQLLTKIDHVERK